MSIVWITAGVALWVIVFEALVLLGKYGPPAVWAWRASSVRCGTR